MCVQKLPEIMKLAEISVMAFWWLLLTDILHFAICPIISFNIDQEYVCTGPHDVQHCEKLILSRLFPEALSQDFRLQSLNSNYSEYSELVILFFQKYLLMILFTFLLNIYSKRSLLMATSE